MTDPRRLLDDGAEGFERELLEAGSSVDPPAGSQRDVWRALSIAIPGGFDPSGGGGQAGGDPGGIDGGGLDLSGGAFAGSGAGSAVAGGAAVGSAVAGGGLAAGGGVVASGGAFFGALKAAAIGAVSAGLLVGANHVAFDGGKPTANEASVSTEAASDAVPTTTATDARGWIGRPGIGTSEAANAVPETAASDDEPAPPDAPSGAGPTTDATDVTDVTSAGAGEDLSGTSASRLAEEAKAVAAARSLLRGGDPLGALGALDQIAKKFPDGVLAQERAALAIEALAASGQRGLASERAKAFLAAFPGSAHADRVRPFL